MVLRIVIIPKLESFWDRSYTSRFLYNTLLNSMYREIECLWLQLKSFLLLEKKSRMDKGSLQWIFFRIPLPKYWYFGSFPSGYFPTLNNDAFVILNTQASNMQSDHFVMITNYCHELYFNEALGRGM